MWSSPLLTGKISEVSIPNVPPPILRDDLADGGAAHIAATVVALKATKPSLMVEVGVWQLHIEPIITLQTRFFLRTFLAVRKVCGLWPPVVLMFLLTTLRLWRG